MSPPVKADLIRRCEELARPLYAGIDGVQTFDRVERARRRLELLARGEPDVDGELLAVLTVFHGVAGRLGPLGPGGRLDLFLRGQGLDDGRRAAVRRGLGRFSTAPATVEERLLHDAALLEEAGVPAAVARLLAAGKKRVPARRAVAALDVGPAPERFATAAGEEWARREQEVTAGWRSELEAFFAAADLAERRESDSKGVR